MSHMVTNINVKYVAVILALLFIAGTAGAQNYPNMVPSTSQIAFANPDGTPLYPGQTGQAQVTFTIQNGPLTFKTRDAFCIVKPGGKEYMAECDDVTMDAGCMGTWQSGQECTITYSFLADGDDNRCNVTGTSPAYPDGCEGTVQIKVPNSPNIVPINYSVETYDPNPQMKVIPAKLNFPPTLVGTDSPPSMTSEIVNSGNVALAISNIALANGPAYMITSNDCPNPLPAQMSCDVTVSFTPTKTGPNDGKISLSDNAANHPPSDIYLSGTGTAAESEAVAETAK